MQRSPSSPLPTDGAYRAIATIPAAARSSMIPETYRAGKFGVEADVRVPAGDVSIMNELGKLVELLHAMAARSNQFGITSEHTRKLIRDMRILATDVQEEIELRRGPSGMKKDTSAMKHNQAMDLVSGDEISKEVVLVKKYGNRKIYSETTGAYVTMLELSDLVAEGRSVKVTDDQTGKDLTVESLARMLYERVRDRNPGPRDPAPADFERLIAMIERASHDDGDDEK